MEIFVTVVESQGFTAAAQRLGISRAAVSKQVIHLEESLGARLLNRTTRRVSVTEVGQAYYERCQRVIEEVAEADRMVEQLHSEPRGTLKVSAPMSFGMSHIGPAVSEFLARYPQIRVGLNLNDQFTDLIEEGVDVALRITQTADSSHVATRIATVACILVASPDYLARSGMPERPEDLETHACLNYVYLSSGTEWHLSGPDGVHAVRVSGPMWANNGEVLLRAAEAGLGITILPKFIATDSLAKGTAVRVLPDYQLPDLSLFAVSPPNRFPAAKVRTFIDFLSDRFGDATL